MSLVLELEGTTTSDVRWRLPPAAMLQVVSGVGNSRGAATNHGGVVGGAVRRGVVDPPVGHSPRSIFFFEVCINRPCHT
jgi:hypothetical protein